MAYIITKRDEDGIWFLEAVIDGHSFWSTQKSDAWRYMTHGYAAKIAARCTRQARAIPDYFCGPAMVRAVER